MRSAAKCSRCWQDIQKIVPSGQAWQCMTDQQVLSVLTTVANNYGLWRAEPVLQWHQMQRMQSPHLQKLVGKKEN